MLFFVVVVTPCIVVAVQPCMESIPIKKKNFSMCLKKSSFLNCWKVSLVVPVFKNIGVLLNTTALLVFFLWLFGLISYFLSNRWLWMVLDGLHKNIKLML